LQGRRKGGPQKLRIAARLRRETTMTLWWIAERLCMGAATHPAFLLQAHQRKEPNSEDTLFWPLYDRAPVTLPIPSCSKQ